LLFQGVVLKPDRALHRAGGWKRLADETTRGELFKQITEWPVTELELLV
jgi:hypothetical protein